jgi:hypothetical protein
LWVLLFSSHKKMGSKERKKKSRTKKKKNAGSAKRLAESRARQKEAARRKREEDNLRASEKLFDEETKKFESNLQNLKLNHCVCCWQVKIGITLDSNNHCNECKNLPTNHYIEQRVLPVWYDKNGMVNYELPEQLVELTLGEKMLIQAAAPFVPLRHIWKDQVGVKGHVCSFPQSVDEIAHELPRLPHNVNVVRMIRSFKSQQHGEISTRTFLIRKNKVINALKWLNVHNAEYQNITINETNLNWMDDKDEADLPGVKEIITNQTEEDAELEASAEDVGPSKNQSSGYNSKC